MNLSTKELPRYMMPIAIGHFMITLGLAFMGFAAAYGSGMSDMDHGDGGAGGFLFLLGVWQLPVAIIQMVVIAFHKDGSGLPPGALFLLAAFSSLAFGFVVGVLLWRPQGKERK